MNCCCSTLLRIPAVVLGITVMCGASRAQTPAVVTLSTGDRVAARYLVDPNPMKPYVKELITPAGVQLLLDSPADHLHHHGLMFAIGVGEADFWTESPVEEAGRQVPRVGTTVSTPKGVRQTLDWIDPKGISRLVEERSVEVEASAPQGPTVLTWFISLRPSGPLATRLWGRHYFGLGMRLGHGMDKLATFVFPSGTEAGRVVRSDETLRAARWCAARGLIDGKPVTVAMFEHPGNTRRPTLWFTMTQPFAYVSATLDLEKQPIELLTGQVLTVRYFVVAWDGTQEREVIEEWYSKLSR